MRISVLGFSCSGKTTFSNELGTILNLPVYHLDNYYWSSAWVKNPSCDITSIVNQDNWIIDGIYTDCCFEERLEASDYIFYLDCNLLVRLWRMIRRHIVYLIAPTGKNPISQKVSISFILSTIKKVRYLQPEILKHLRDLYPKKLLYTKGKLCATFFLERINNDGFFELFDTDKM